MGPPPLHENDHQDVTPFFNELRSFNMPQLSMGKEVLAYHLAHPEHAMSPDLRAKLRVALLSMIEEGLISIADSAWDDHRTDSLPHTVLLLSLRTALNDMKMKE